MLENHPDSPESRKYLEFLEEAGIERVGSYMRWVYLRKKAADGPFDLFSDYESRMFFDRCLRRAGIFDRLEQLGIKDGETVCIYDLMFDFRY